MADEYFYGVTLSASHQFETWDPESKAEYVRSNKLLIRQVLLGPDAKPDEINVVQVEAMSLQETIKIPIAVLKVGESRCTRLDIEFPDAPVAFSLIQGSGPVHIIGQQMLNAIVEEFEEEMEEEMLDEEEGDDSQFKENENNRKATAAKRKPNEDEDDEEGEPKGKKSKMSNNAKGKAPSPKKNAKK